MKKLLLAVGILLIYATANAQQPWLGYSSSNYSGINGIYMNPSAVVDSRYRVHINLIGLGFNMNNDYLKFKAPFSLYDGIRNKVDAQYLDSNGNTDFKGEYLQEDLNGKPKNMSISLIARLPSFLVSIGENNAIGFSTRTRAGIQFFDVAEPIARFMRWGTDTTSAGYQGEHALTAGQIQEDNRFAFNINALQEFNFTYGRVLWDNDKSFFKAGITVKYLIGLGSFYIQNNKLGYQTGTGDTVVVLESDINYGYVDERYYYQDGLSPNTLLFDDPLGKGLGLDLGVTYERRSKIEKYKYEMDGKIWRDRSKTKYRYKVGAALTDFGSIKYNHSQYVTTINFANEQPVTWADIDTLNARNFGDNDINGFADIDSTIRSVFPEFRQGRSFTSKLPLTLNLTGDYRIMNHVYVNATWIQSLRKKGKVGLRQQSLLSVAPRWEFRHIEIGMPLSLINDYRNFKMGVFTRLGPIYVGSDNLGGLFGIGDFNGTDIYFGATIPIYAKKHKDKDKDKVSNRKDECINVPGIWAFKGCPDTDRDSIPDSEDACPFDSGVAEFKGCPDTDGDHITDSLDDCPTIPGPKDLNGCPDTDGDGVVDPKDSCVNEFGKLEFNGCPDRDNDGIPDKEDNCPDDFGSKQFSGCPDTDGDGIEDIKDKCPLDSGLVEYKGCPDSDGDKVPDYSDLCPLTPGLVENNGCPKEEVEKVELLEITPEEELILREVFDNLEFETGSSEIKISSYVSLNELVELMNARPEYRIRIEGHTDNVGNDAANLALSKARAAAVKTYLVSKGIDASRIETQGYGESRPVADNDTDAGKQRNRRVEFRVIK